MSDAPFVTVVVPVRNGEATIQQCLTSLQHLQYPSERHEVLVVDNGSSDRTAEIVRRYPVRCLREDRRGLSHARNRGIEASRGQIVAFTDADCVVTTDWLTELVSGLGDPRLSAVAGEVVAYPPTTAAERYLARRRPLWQEPRCRGQRRPWFLFGNVAVRREVFARVGLFDPRFAGGGAEDIDYSWRFFNAGCTLAYRPRALVFHRHRMTPHGLLRQQIAYGRGQAVLRRKYPQELPWGWRHEIAAWKDLGASAGRLLCLWLNRPPAAAATTAADYPIYDLIRKVGQRIGFAYGTLAARRED
jgi:glycosyltransferase involved in cell wall biosynthesis